MSLRVAVIGAGFSGVFALRHLTALPDKFEVTAFEQSDVIGGTWVYTDQVGKDKYGEPIFTSMYRDLRTNLPKEVMGLPDFPYDQSLPSFMRHDDVRSWVEKYATHFNVYQYIQFLTRVVKVKPKHPDCAGTKWEVITRKVRQKDAPEICTEFDAVIVCNGHFSTPYVPNIQGMEEFTGDVIHSHDYRKREDFSDKTVIVLGAGFSGIDIGLDVAKIAKEVILSHNIDPWKCPFPPNMRQAPGISYMKSGTAVLLDGSEIQVDSVILCTGYERNYEFLSHECGIRVQDGRITPLYKHVFNTSYPSMALIGVCDNVIPFCFHHQAKFVAKVLSGEVALPSKQEMDLDTSRDFEERIASGMSTRQAHYMSRRMWPYYEDICKVADVEAVPKAVPLLYDDHLRDSINNRFHEYKNDNYEYVGNDRYRVIPRKC